VSTIINAEDVRVGDRIKVTRTYDHGTILTTEIDVAGLYPGPGGHNYAEAPSHHGAWLTSGSHIVTIELIRREIPEPKGLGAVVRLKDGAEYVRTGSTSKRPWAGRPIVLLDWRSWSALQDDVAEVLSEGYVEKTED